MLVGGSLHVRGMDRGRKTASAASTPRSAASGAAPFGQVLLVAVGIGWIVAGLYAFLRAGIARTA